MTTQQEKEMAARQRELIAKVEALYSDLSKIQPRRSRHAIAEHRIPPNMSGFPAIER